MAPRRVLVTRLNRWKRVYGVRPFCVKTAIASSAQVFTALLEVEGTDGALPTASLVQGRGAVPSSDLSLRRSFA